MPVELESVKGIRKAAVLCVLLGEDVSSTLFRSLWEDEIETLSKEISQLSNISSELTDAVLEEYHNLVVAKQYIATGGIEYTKKVLNKALGNDGSRRVIDKVTKSLESSVGFNALGRTDPQLLSRFIQNEHPQTIALIISHLEPLHGAELLTSLPEHIRPDVVMRIANLGEISPEIVKRISLLLSQKINTLGSTSGEASGGTRAVAELVNRMDRPAGRAILEKIETQNVASVSLDATPGAHSFSNGTSANVATPKQGFTVTASGVTNPVCNAPSNPVVTVVEGFPGAFVQHVAVGGITPQSPRSGYGADANTQIQIALTGLQSGVSLNWPDSVTGSAATGTLVIVSESSTAAVYQYSTTNQATSDSAIESFAVVPIVTMTPTSASGQATVQAQMLPVAATASLPRFDDPLQPASGPNFITVIGCNPAPQLAAINPSSIAAGQSPFTITVTGSNFVNGSVVRWNLQARSTSYVDSTQLRADILAGDIVTAVPVSVTVESPARAVESQWRCRSPSML